MKQSLLPSQMVEACKSNNTDGYSPFDSRTASGVRDGV